MIRNYLKMALRNLWRNRTYGGLNILGLAVGVACAALILLWVESEVTFDHHNVKRDRIYAVMNQQKYDATTYTFWATPSRMAETMKAEVPGVVRASRLYWGESLLFSRMVNGERKDIYENGNYADPDLFGMLTIPFSKGRVQGVFDEPRSIVISERMAEKFFGTEDPIGKTLKINNRNEYTVKAVMQNAPENSSFRYDWLIPFATFAQGQDWMENWGSNGMMTYVELDPKADLAQVNKQIYGLINRKDKEVPNTSFLFPMNEWRLYDRFENGVQAGGRITYVRLFTIVACFILLIACINFMNLATARSEKRAREVGMRKVMGGTRGMLIGQFLGESLVLSFLSVGFAVGIAQLSLPFFNDLVEKHLSLNLPEPMHIAGLVGIGLVTGLLAGSYPSFYLSSFAPVAVLKGLRLKTDAGAGFVRRGLVVLQFSISIMLIVGTVIVYQQVSHVRARAMGYDREHLIYLTLQDRNRYEYIRRQLLASGVAENAGLSSGSALYLSSQGGNFSWPGKDPGTKVLVNEEHGSADYLPTLGVSLAAGRFFRSDLADTAGAIINTTLARLVAGSPEKALGVKIDRGDGKLRDVIGVTDDFVFNNFYAAIGPAAYYYNPEWGANLTIRLKRTADLTGLLAKTADVMKEANPGFPFEYKFVDEEFNRAFNSEALIGKLAAVFAGLAILISCLGLFGLAAYTAERRTKEIGIRKVLGASMQSVVQLLSKEFVALVGISCLVAFPLAWWGASTWLQDYSYRTPIHWWVFGLAGLGALMIALGTVSLQAIRAAIANPVKSLRTE